MSKFNLVINGNISVNQDKKSYKSIIQDLGEDYFLMSIPVINGVYLTLNEGEELSIDYYVEGGNYFTFNSKVIKRVVDNKIPFYKLSLPYNVSKVQRRDFVRVNLFEYVFYKKGEEDGEGTWEKGMLLDLSGGGLRIKVRDKVQMGDKIVVNLFINEEKVHVTGKVVRVEINTEREIICGLRFIEMDERKRDKIIEKVFIQMRKQRERL
ncbi:flagellar brake protein [Clostridium sp. LP20]|uniref:flagellar brake protein n=1 Tax=Clostridium sp. LP20 TaxID=3418665 RepID=UPI003EE7F169